MGKKLDDGTLQDSCLEKLYPGERFFVLRAQDLLAPQTIRAWANEAIMKGMTKEKYDEAMACAAEMEQWPDRKYPD